jgi:hypothetical protein
MLSLRTSQNAIRQLLPPPKPPSQVVKPTSYQVNNSLTYFAAKVDLGVAYPDLPLGGPPDAIQAFAWAHCLPIFTLSYANVSLFQIVYCWVSYPLVPIPLAFVYVDAGFREASMGFQDFFVYQVLINMPTQQTPLVMRGGDSGLSLISCTDSLYLPFIPPAPYWPKNALVPPNPFLQFVRGGSVPVDLSGISDFIGAFV